MVVFAETPIAVQAARSLRRTPEWSDLCACGCGELLSAKVRAARYLHAEGFSYADIGREIGATSKYARAVINGSSTQRAPTYLKGHYRLSTEQHQRALDTHARNRALRERQEELRAQRILAEAVARIRAGDTRLLSYQHYTARLVRERCPDIYEEACAAREAERERIRAAREAERERIRAARLEERWIKWALRQHNRDLRSHEKRQRDFQRRIDREQRETVRDGSVSLDVTLTSEDGRTWLDVMSQQRLRRPTSEDPAEVVHAESIWELVGDVDPSTLGEQELRRLQQRVLAAGFSRPSVQASELDRLRAPNRHAGASVAKSRGHGGGKRSRKAQQQVTRDHHVREMTDAQKQAHKQRREVRKAA